MLAPTYGGAIDAEVRPELPPLLQLDDDDVVELVAPGRGPESRGEANKAPRPESPEADEETEADEEGKGGVMFVDGVVSGAKGMLVAAAP